MEAIEIAKKLKEQDQQVFSSLIESHSLLLWTVAGRYLAKSSGFSAEDIEECVSDVFFELWKHPERYDPQKGELKTYLCTITKNKAISLYRKNIKNQTLCFVDFIQSKELQTDEPLDVPDYTALYGALSALPEPTREILVRRYFYEEKPAEIAKKMALPKKEVENRLYRGKESLSHSLIHLQEVL